MKTKWHILYALPMIAAIALFAWASAGCQIEDDGLSADPYAGGKAPLGIKFSTAKPMPQSAYPGEEVIFSIDGAQPYFDAETGEYDFDFFISDERAEVVSVNDTLMTVVIPENVSSGLSSIVLNGQIFFGPRFEVLGNVKIDAAYQFKSAHIPAATGRTVTGAIYTCLPHMTKAGNIYMGGSFSRITTGTSNSQERYGLAMVDERGMLIGENTVDFKIWKRGIGLGVENLGNYVRSMSRFSDGKVLISGYMSQYDPEKNNNFPLSNMTVANSDLSLWTETVDVIGIGSSSAIAVDAHCFNGGTEEPPVRTFVTSDDMVIAVGNLNTYNRIDFSTSGASSYYARYVYTEIASVVCMDQRGNMIPEYHSRGSEGGANGLIDDACMDSGDNVVIVGQFTAFDGVSAPGIVRLDPDGEVDQTFMANIGTGADGPVTTIRYNKNIGKIAVTGQFNNFNGQPCTGVAILNEDGTLDQDFRLREMLGGRANFACVLDDGKVVVSGTFSKYGGVTRMGFLILDPDGHSVQDLNVPGRFTGRIYEVVETKTSVGNNGLLLLGDFIRFNDTTVKNVVMLETDFQ